MLRIETDSERLRERARLDVVWGEQLAAIAGRRHPATPVLDPPADATARLEHEHRAARGRDLVGGNEAGRAGADNNDIGALG